MTMSPGVAWLRMWLGESEGGQVWCRGAKAEMAISRILGRGLPTKGSVSTAGWCLICQLLVLLAIPAFFNNPCSQPYFLSRSGFGLPEFPLPRPVECLATSWCGRFPGTHGGSSPFYVLEVLSDSSTSNTPSVLF